MTTPAPNPQIAEHREKKLIELLDEAKSIIAAMQDAAGDLDTDEIVEINYDVKVWKQRIAEFAPFDEFEPKTSGRVQAVMWTGTNIDRIRRLCSGQLLDTYGRTLRLHSATSGHTQIQPGGYVVRPMDGVSLASLMSASEFNVLYRKPLASAKKPL